MVSFLKKKIFESFVIFLFLALKDILIGTCEVLVNTYYCNCTSVI